MARKSTRPDVKLTGVPFEAEGTRRLNRHKRRAAAGRFRRAKISRDPLTDLLRTRQGRLWVVAGVLISVSTLYGTALYGMFLARM